MPVPAQITSAAAMFRPNETSNSLLWELGHITWARGCTLYILGVEWSTPWLNEFGRGKSAEDVSQYPSAEELLAAWKEASAALTALQHRCAAQGPRRSCSANPRTWPSIPR